MSEEIHRWCCPKTVLVVMRPSDDPAQILTAIQHAGKSGAKLLLVQLSAGSGLPGCSESSEELSSPWVPIHQNPQQCLRKPAR